jgi:hypothetical protein
MGNLGKLTAGLLVCSASASAAHQRHNWRVYQADPDMRAQVCYPADLLHIHHNKKDEGLIDLVGADDAEVLIGGRSDKYTTLRAELRYSLGVSTSGPSWVHESGPGLTPLHWDDTPQLKVTSSIVTKNSYLYVAENARTVLIEWGIHVDHAIKQLLIIYPKSRAAAWKGVPEHMRSCFKSLGPITNPLLQ